MYIPHLPVIEREHANYLMKHTREESSKDEGGGRRLVSDFHGGLYILPEAAVTELCLNRFGYR